MFMAKIFWWTREESNLRPSRHWRDALHPTKFASQILTGKPTTKFASQILTGKPTTKFASQILTGKPAEPTALTLSILG